MENDQGLSSRLFGKRALGDIGEAPGLQQHVTNPFSFATG